MKELHQLDNTTVYCTKPLCRQ